MEPKGGVSINGTFFEYKSIPLEKIAELLQKARGTNCGHSRSAIKYRLMEGIIDFISKNPDVGKIREKMRKVDLIFDDFVDFRQTTFFDHKNSASYAADYIWMILNF